MPRWPNACSPARLLVALSALLLATTLAPGDAGAQSCPSGNLLQGKRAVAWDQIRNDPALITDGQVGPEGTTWDAALAVILGAPDSYLVWDLGEPTTLHALVVQADANDTFTLSGSLDGRTFRPLGTVPMVEGVHGLRSRELGLGGQVARFIRFSDGVGDGYYSISELQVFCELPKPFPPKLKVIPAPKAQVPTTITTYWNDVSSRWWEFALALAAWMLLNWGVNLAKEGRPKAYQKLRNRLLAIAGVLAALTYVNFFFFHFPNFLHTWDTFHYYVGSKYFNELSYDRLYECVAVADAEDPRLRRRVELRKITNLRTNALETTEDILKHPERCKEHFSAQRWEDFKRDIAYFRNKESPKRWDDTSTDHGYNATPVWNVLGTLLANTAPASDTQIYLLNMLDPAYYVGIILVIWWAFGWRTLSVALLVYATNFPNRFYWTGGAYLRWDWIFYLVASICCLKKNRPILGGMALGYSTLLRVFPGFIFVGPVVAVAAHVVETWLEQRKVAPGTEPASTERKSFFREAFLHERLRPYYLFFVGGAIAAAVLIPVSLKVSGGVASYQAFVQNTVKHKETPLTNHMGLRTVMAYRPSEVGRKLRTDALTDPWKKWKDARLAAWKQAKPAYALVVLGFLVLVGFAVRKGKEPWIAAAFGAAFIALGVELTSYYYAFIIGVAVLYEKREEVGRLLLLVTAFSEFVSLAPVKGMPTWIDEQYTIISFATVLAFFVIAYWFGYGEIREARLLAAAAEAAKTGTKTGSKTETKTDTKAAAPAEGERASEDKDEDGAGGKGRKKRRS